MSDPVFAEKDVSVVLSEALALYKVRTGVTLAPADPRRLHLQTFVLLLAQQRQLINYSGLQNLLRFADVGKEIEDATNLKALGDLWGEQPLPAKPSKCTERFTFSVSGVHTIPAGVRVTEGVNTWAVTGATSGIGTFVDAPVECTVAGGASNGVIAGQITTLIDADLVPGCSGVSNTTETISGKDTESTEAYRERLRSVPESRSTCGPRLAYEAAAQEASASVADAVALGANDGPFMAGTAPAAGEVHVIVIQGERDDEGVLTSVIPSPTVGLLDAVDEALSAEDVRPLTDLVIVKAPEFVDVDLTVTYYIARSRAASVVEIQAAVEDAFTAFQLWQESAIGRDINPSECHRQLVNAGAKRITITSSFVFTALKRDESVRLGYVALTYGGVEDD